MRQGQQQNRQRSRGRGGNRNQNNNNRNQLNRSMESNGPDVRIRGTAAHIAEKYTQLARDAQTSGDTVAAESYWQFAEHYNRLIAAAQAAHAEQQAQREEERARRNADDGDGESGDGDDQRGGRGRNRGRRGRHEQSDDRSARDGGRDSDENDEKSGAQVPGEGPQPVVGQDADNAKSDDVAETAKDDASAKPKRARKPRKAADAESEAAEPVGELPAFISGSAAE
ncbi:MAG: DUF4167 domain-containing protein [Pseudomonadota bacterium]